MKIIKDNESYEWSIYINDLKIQVYVDDFYDGDLYIKIKNKPNNLKDLKETTYVFFKKSVDKEYWLRYLEKLSNEYNFLIEEVLYYLGQRILNKKE